jgi:hypothetical protein
MERNSQMVEMDVVMTPIGASGVGVPFELASRRTCDGERSELAQIKAEKMPVSVGRERVS